MKLKDAKITGFVTRAQADGMCAHCGMGIKHCVIVVDPASGEEVTIGTTCAERVGIDAAMVRGKVTHEMKADREAREEIEAAERRAKAAPMIAARKIRGGELADTVLALREMESPFFASLADQLESSQSLSGRQAEYVCKAFSGTGRRNKKNASEWDARFLLITGEEY